MSVLLFIIILLVLVFVHELGHFLVAKWTKMRVDEFAFGFPPRIFSKKVGETTYSFNSLPLGGYVSIFGETGESNDEAKNNPRAFGNRPWWAQLSVLAAGVVMNMLFAWIVFVGSSWGEVKVSASDEVYGNRIKDASVFVIDAYKESPAYKAGIVPGSVILNLQSGSVKIKPEGSTSTISFIESHINDPIKITYRKINGEIAETTVTGVYGIVPDKKVIGVSLDTIGTVSTTLPEAIDIGTEKFVTITILTLDGLKTLASSLVKGESVIESLSGPVGIAKMVGDASQFGLAALFTFAAVLSINLAIFNALPIPALDGGRFIIVIFETLLRKKLPVKILGIANGVSFLLLILLLIVVTVKDVTG